MATTKHAKLYNSMITARAKYQRAASRYAVHMVECGRNPVVTGPMVDTQQLIAIAAIGNTVSRTRRMRAAAKLQSLIN